MFPIFGEDDTPESIDNGVNWRVVSEKQPCREPKSGWEYQKGEVGLGEGKVKGNLSRKLAFSFCNSKRSTYLLAEPISDIIQIFWFEKPFRAPVFDPLLVEDMIMQRKNRLHIFPVSMLWSDARTSVLGIVRNQLIYNPQSLGFVQRIMLEGLSRLLLRKGSSNAVNPISYPTKRQSTVDF